MIVPGKVECGRFGLLYGVASSDFKTKSGACVTVLKQTIMFTPKAAKTMALL